MSHSNNSADFELEKYCIVASILAGMLKNARWNNSVDFELENTVL